MFSGIIFGISIDQSNTRKTADINQYILDALFWKEKIPVLSIAFNTLLQLGHDFILNITIKIRGV